MIFLKIYLTIVIIFRAYLYTYIADRNNFNLGGNGGFSFLTLWFYRREVAAEYKRLKKICNYIQIHNLVLIIIILIIGWLL